MDGNIALSQGQFASPGVCSSYPYQVPNGYGALAAYYAGSPPWGQGWSGNVLGQLAQPIGGIGFLGQSGRPIGLGVGGAFGIPQYGSNPGGWGGQLYGSPQAMQTIQYATQQAAEVAQQVAQQAAHQVAQQAALAAQQVAHQAAHQVAQQATLTAQQVAQQAAQQVAQQAALTAQVTAQQAAQQAVAGGIGQQQIFWPGNAFGQYAIPQLSGWQGGYGIYPGQQQPYGINLGGGFGYPQFGGVGFGMGQPGLRGLNPFAGTPLGAQTQLAGSPRFSFA